MAVIITYDENGGYWDHVPPPSDRAGASAGGPGTRVPAIIVSPFAKRGYVTRRPTTRRPFIKFITDYSSSSRSRECEPTWATSPTGFDSVRT